MVVPILNCTIHCVGAAFVIAAMSGSTRIANAADSPPVYAAEFSHRGDLFAVGLGRKGTLGGLVIYSTKTLQAVHAIPLPGGAGCVAFSNDDRRLAVGRWNGEALLIGVKSGQIEQTLEHPKGVTGVAFTRDGQLLTSCSDRQVRFWSLKSGGVARQFDAQHGNLHGLALSPNGKLLATAGGERTAKVWSVARGDLLWTSPRAGSIVRSVRFSPDGGHLLTTDWGGKTHMLETKSFSSVMEIRSGGMDCARVSPDLSWLAVAGMGRDVCLFRIDLSRPSETERDKIAATIAKFKSNDYQVRQSASKELETFGLPAVAQLRSHRTNEDAEVRMRCRLAAEQIRNPEPTAWLGGHEGDTECAAFSPDNRWLVTGSRGATLRIWDFESLTVSGELDEQGRTLSLPLAQLGREASNEGTE